MPHLFVEGSVIKLLRNLGFNRHTNGVFKLLTDQLHHTIGLPDRLTKIFGLSKPVPQSKSTQNTYRVQACIKHWLKGNSIKFYNKSGCLLRVETTINKSDLPGLKLKKPACNLQAYYWYGHKCNSRYQSRSGNLFQMQAVRSG